MTSFDPLDGLLALGVITREQLDESARVDPSIATTRTGRLVAVGVDAGELLQALSSLTGVRLASREQLDAAAAPVDGIAPAVEDALRALPAAPLGRSPDGVLDIAVADPTAVPALAALGIQRHRPWLALEVHVRDVLERTLPPLEEADAALAPDAPPSPSPSSSSSSSSSPSPPSSAPLAAPLIIDVDGPPQAPLGSPPPHAQDGPAITLLRAGEGPRSGEGAPAGEGPPADDSGRMERARPVREKYAPGARPQNDPRVPARDPAREDSSSGPRVARPPAAGTPPGSTRAPPAAGTPPGSTRAPPAAAPGHNGSAAPAAREKAAEVPRSDGGSGGGGGRKGLIAAAAVVGVVAAGAALFFGAGLSERLFAPPAAPVDDTAARQQKELDEAKKEAAAGNPTMAIIHCEAVLAIDKTTPLAHEAKLLHAEQTIVNGELAHGLEELRQLVNALPPGSAIRQKAEARLQTAIPSTGGLVDDAPAPPK